jgi:protein-S-isoprenylcysteine O-methyltransferase Ste14
MSYQDSFKPAIATALLALYLPVPFYLLWVHGLQRVWRRVGILSYAAHLSLYGAMVFAVIRLHALWSWNALPWWKPLGLFAVVPLAFAAVLAYGTYRTIDFETLHQIRQIRPDVTRHLIHDGILGRMRHPRYTMFTLIAIGDVLLTGYPLVLASALLTAALFALVIRVEERELLAYFGEEYRQYRRSVPAFIPRISGGRGGAA